MAQWGSSVPKPNSGQTGRKIARYKKNRRQVAKSNPAKPFYTQPTIVGVGSGPGSGLGPGSVVTMTFDMVVSVNHGAGLPGYTDQSQVPALTVIAVAQITPTEITVTFNGTVQPGDVIAIRDLDPVVRTSTGGYVQPGNYVAP